MSVGEVVFNIANGYDADMWDDSLLIRQYERAYESSKRELKKRKSEAGKRKRNWQLGDGCRVVYESDGLEYEGTIVSLTARKATVRLHGYKEELQVPVGELAESLGQNYIMDQIAEAQMEVVSEDPYTEPVRKGQFCRAFWSLDGSVYEGKIESISGDQVLVRFLGYDNTETVLAADLLQSKGQEWRDLQIEDAELDFEPKNNELSVDVDKLVQDNSEVLAKLPGLPEVPSLDSLSLNETKTHEKKHKQKKIDKEDTKKTKSSKGDAKPKSSKSEEKKKKSSEYKSGQVPALPEPSSYPSLPASMLPDLRDISALPGLGSLPSLKTPLLGSGCSDSFGGGASLPPPGAWPSSFGSGGPSLPAPPPPPPPLINNSSSLSDNQQVLNSMLMSWYMAGYHTGVYQASQQVKKKKKRRPSD
eukprot:TRINITY_DN1440_c0_g1_i4.p1 TRINITY_DN1440_c0_g1~~TRINITY_DN1440_c0_g1_i4.p1  ORF type:complete len:417 (-),score=87.03 TRINITY_DN1440_c0_g1_i4:97-1347(-)